MLREADAFDLDEDVTFGLEEAPDSDVQTVQKRAELKRDLQISAAIANHAASPSIGSGTAPDELDSDPSQRRQRWWSGQEDAILFFLIGFIVTTFTLLIDFFVVELFS